MLTGGRLTVGEKIPPGTCFEILRGSRPSPISGIFKTWYFKIRRSVNI